MLSGLLRRRGAGCRRRDVYSEVLHRQRHPVSRRRGPECDVTLDDLFIPRADFDAIAELAVGYERLLVARAGVVRQRGGDLVVTVAAAAWTLAAYDYERATGDA